MRAKRPLKIPSRLSTVTNAFVQAILPHTRLSGEEEATLRTLLDQEGQVDWCCVYCGKTATEWDHLFPLVAGRKPSGHLNVFGNLVPACGPCNHSKGAQDWKQWIRGKAPNSPATRGLDDLDDRVAVLERYATAYRGAVKPQTLFAEAEYDAYWAKLDAIASLMREAQKLGNQLREEAERRLGEQSGSRTA